MNLKYFTQPATLAQIGPSRLAKFLDPFRSDVAAASLPLPEPAPANGE